MNKKVLIIGALGCALIVCCVAIVAVVALGGLAAFNAFNKEFENANENVKAICAEVNDGDYANAYDLTSESYQTFNNLFQFQSFAEEELDGCTEMDGSNTQINLTNNVLTIETDLEYENGSERRATFTFEKDGEDWKLDDLNL